MLYVQSSVQQIESSRQASTCDDFVFWNYWFCEKQKIERHIKFEFRAWAWALILDSRHCSLNRAKSNVDIVGFTSLSHRCSIDSMALSWQVKVDGETSQDQGRIAIEQLTLLQQHLRVKQRREWVKVQAKMWDSRISFDPCQRRRHRIWTVTRSG